LDPLKMAPLAAFGLTDEETSLMWAYRRRLRRRTTPWQSRPSRGTQDASERPFEVADEEPELDVELPAGVAPAADAAAEDSRAEQRDAEDSGAEDLQDAGDDAVDAVDLGVEELQMAATTFPRLPTRSPATCADCHDRFSSGDPSEVIDGRLYHRRDCAEAGSRIATAAK
jgi:hypothetical protein